MIIQLLGGFSIIYEEKPLSASFTARLQSLLTYLILNPNIPQSRQYIAYTLWPDTSESNARNNLRQFIYQLRHILPTPDRFLTTEPNTVCWHQNDSQEIDVQRFERCIEETDSAVKRADLSSARAWLTEAVSIYRGELLPGCYDDWIISHRERFRQRYYSASQKLIGIIEQQRDYPAALQAAKLLVSIDPLDESTYVTLMRLYDLDQNRSAARRVYQTAVETLRHELGVEPSETLRLAYERLQSTSGTQFPEVDAVPLTMVGRQAEWQQLQKLWKYAVNGNAQFTLITGEAGIGKSRLAEELYTWANKQGFTTARAHCYAAEGRLSLAPVIEWLRNPTIHPHLNTLDKVWLTEVARLLPELLSENKDLTHAAPIGEYGQRQHFFEALARAILAAPLPVLLWIDDLQWCDPETIEWLHFLLRYRPHNPLLVLGTVRSEESPLDHPLVGFTQQLQGEGKFVSIALFPLDAAETARLASQIEGREMEVSTTMDLFRATEGNPLFIVETLRSGIGIGTDDKTTTSTVIDPETRKLPPRVYAVIARRLAQLSPIARRVTELAAAIGREFTLEVLLRAGQDNESSTMTALDELWQKRILHEQGANLFNFTHDKLREIAYAETSAPKRLMIHRQIAQALEVLNAESLDEVSGHIAAQFELAGMVEQSLPYYLRAGEFAAGIYANEDAIGLFEHGLSFLLKLPSSVKRDTQELSLQLALATLYRLSKGWASPEEERVMNRILILSEKVGTPEQRIRTLFGLQTLYVVQARYEKVEQTYAQAEKLYIQTYNTPPPPFVGISLAGARLCMGQMTESRELFEKIISVRNDKHIRDLQASQGLNYLVHGHAWNAHTMWCLGYPHQALNMARTAAELAQEFMQPFNQALAMTYMAMLWEWCADPALFLSQAEDANAFASTIKATYYQAWTNILVCFARTRQQIYAKDDGQLYDSIRTFTETGAHIRLPVYYSLLARACQQAGQIDQGLEAIELGLSESLRNGERWWESELHRLRGELIWSQGADIEDVEAAFQRSIEIAISQKAKSLELRAVMGLAKLWQANGRSADAKQLLMPLYAWFSEGFETPDLRKAQTLIAGF